LVLQVWDIAGDPSLKYLRREDFYVAMRLIAMAQTSPGIPISSDRLAAESGVLLPLARMQNVPPPPPGCVSKGISHSGSAAGHANSVAAADPYAMSAQEKSKYESIFPMYDADRDGFVTGPEAVDLFSKSRLPRDTLRVIWQLADADGDSKLSLAEFCVGMHLIVCVSKKGLAVPTSVPPGLHVSVGIVGTGPGSVASLSQEQGGSPSPSVPQSPVVRRSPGMQPLQTPWVISSLEPVARSGAGAGDAFSTLAVDLPTARSTSSVGSDTEVKASPFTMMDQGQSAATPSPHLRAAQPQEMSAMRSTTNSTASEDFLVGEFTNKLPPQSGNPMQEVTAASNASLTGTIDAPPTPTQAAVTPPLSARSLGTPVQHLEAAKFSLAGIVEAGKVEHMDNERQLRDMGSEMATLQAQLDGLRNEFMEQQKETIRLRARITQAAVERATLLAEIKGCDASLYAQKVRSAYASFAAIHEKDASHGTSSPRRATAVSPSSLLAERAEHLHSSPVTEEIKAKTEAPPEPAMPAETPPLPPHAMVAQPHDVEDPFAEEAEAPNEEGSEDSSAASSSAQAETEPAEKGMLQSNNEENLQDGFDAFPPVDGFDNGSDPFAANDFGGNGSGEVTVDDPFSASDAVFTNATAATSDGFDAFTPSTGAHFDAFGQ
ncbi:unnamed protein product, partial [Laminaria digitata]